MPAVEGTLDLIVDPALASLERVESAASAMLEAIGSTQVNIAVEVDSASLDELSASLADLTATTITLGMEVDSEQLDSLRETLDGLTTVTVAAEVDTGQVDDLVATVAGIDGTALDVSVALDDDALQAVDTTPIPVEVTLDPASVDAVLSELGALGETARIVVAVELDQGSLSELEAALAAIQAPDVSIAVDVSEVEDATASVDALTASLDDAASATVEVPVDTSSLDATTESAGQATAALGSLGDVGASAGGALTAATDIASGSVANLASKIPVAGAAVAAVGASIGVLFTAAEKGRAANERLNIVFGDQAEAVQKIDVEGLTGDLGALAQQAGSSGARLKQAAADTGQFAKAAGAGDTEAVAFTRTVTALSLRAVTLRPALGQAGDAQRQLTLALARGGRTLEPYNLSLTKGAIEARAMADSHKTNAAELTVYERAAAGAALATEQLSGRIGSDFQEATEQSAIKLRALQAALGSALGKAGADLVEPIIDALTELVPVAQAVAGALGEMAPVFLVPLKLAVPILKAIGFLLDHIPTPVLHAVAAFITFNTALRVLSATAAATGISINASLGAIALIVSAGVGLASALGVFGSKTEEASAATQEWTGFLTATADALNTAEAAAIATGQAIGGVTVAQRSSEIVALTKTIGDTADRFGEAGISVGNMYDAIRGGVPALVAFRQRLLDSNVVTLAHVADTKAAQEGLFAFRREYLVTGDAGRAYARAVRDSGGALLSATLVGEAYANVLKTQAAASGEALESARTLAEGQIVANDATETGAIKAILGTSAWDDLSRSQRDAAAALLRRAAAEEVGAAATEALTAAVIAERDVLIDLARAEIKAADATKVDNVAKLVTDGLLGSLTGKERAHAIALLSTADALGGNAAASKALQQIQKDAEAQAKDLADAYKEIDDAVSGAADAFRAYLGIPLTALEQQVALAEGQRSVTEALKENGATLDLHTKKGLANANALGAIAKQGLDAAAAAVKQGEGAAGAAAAMQTYRDALIKGATAAGLTAEQAGALADAVGLIPAKAAIELAATGGAKAVEDVAALATFVEENLPETVVLRLRADGAVTVQETITAIRDNFGLIPPEKRTKLAVDFKELLVASGHYEEFRKRPDLAKILRVADESDEARESYEALERFPDIAHFMKVNPDVKEAIERYDFVAALKAIQKKFHLDDSEVKAVAKNYREFQLVKEVRKKVYLDGTDVVRTQQQIETLRASPKIEQELEIKTTITASVVTVRVGGGTVVGDVGGTSAYGNIYAAGGVRRKRRDDVAEMHQPEVSPATPGARIWAEPETQGESYIPWAQDRRPRATSILAQTADAFGFRLEPAVSARADARPMRVDVSVDVVEHGSDAGAAALAEITAEWVRANAGVAEHGAAVSERLANQQQALYAKLVAALAASNARVAAIFAQQILNSFTAAQRDAFRAWTAAATGQRQSVDATKISKAEIERLLAMGWRGDPNDNQERLYAPPTVAFNQALDAAVTNLGRHAAERAQVTLDTGRLDRSATALERAARSLGEASRRPATVDQRRVVNIAKIEQRAVADDRFAEEVARAIR